MGSGRGASLPGHWANVLPLGVRGQRGIATGAGSLGSSGEVYLGPSRRGPPGVTLGTDAETPTGDCSDTKAEAAATVFFGRDVKPRDDKECC